MTDPARQNRSTQLSEILLRARDTRLPVAPLTDSFPDLSVADAYVIARHGVRADIDTGAKLVGHKIGLTSTVVQQQLGVDSPDYGALLDTMQIADGAAIGLGDYIAPRIELELAFRLGARLAGPNVTVDDVRAATATVHPAIELVDSRIADWKITLADTVADRASSAGFVVSDAAFALDDIDIAAVDVELIRNGERAGAGRSDAVLGDPCVAVAWLANALSEFGEALEPGELILSGACTRMIPLVPGDRYQAIFSGLGELTLEVSR